jgi:hypothetical protein
MEPVNPQNARTRIQIEFIEMPDLKLTLAQLSRLCDVPRDICDAAVASLLNTGFLALSGDGRLLRGGLGRTAAGRLDPDPLAVAS